MMITYKKNFWFRIYVKRILKLRMENSGIELSKNLDPNIPEIIADQAQINQVLINLVVNAIQAMPNGGKLSVTTRLLGENISMVVEDTGEGMTEEIKKQIFLPFFTTKEVSQGTGLGLAVVHGIITSHYGAIEAESEPGKGTTVRVGFFQI